ncbi:MAG: tetratricopeptide repeat protein [Nitrospirae bacterium]|nr:tetratricopeptide repeat protein [Nitrospirota bacterium]MBF0535190.1 tetratricopeptide repeat protein [Nitrospirota bacterium]MBF0615191.1 tetratricopeptide repeat protein [Nitrospirota bacterium]
MIKNNRQIIHNIAIYSIAVIACVFSSIFLFNYSKIRFYEQRLFTLPLTTAQLYRVLPTPIAQTQTSDTTATPTTISPTPTATPSITTNQPVDTIQKNNVNINGDGNVSVTSTDSIKILANKYNIPIQTARYLVKALSNQLQNKYLNIAEVEAQLQELSKKYKELEKQLAKPPEIDTLATQAKAKLDSGDLPEAERLLKLSMEHNLKEAENKSKELAEARVKAAASDTFSLAKLKSLEIKYQEALDYYEKAVELDPQNTLYLNEAGFMYDTLGQYQNAIEYYEQALKIDKKNFGDNHPNIARDLNNLGMAYVSLGQYQKAIYYFEQALAIYKNELGDNYPNVAISLNNLGEAYVSLGQYQKSLYYLEQALTIDKKNFGDNHPNIARDLNNLGMAWGAMGEYKKAIEYFGLSLAIDRKNLGDNHPNVARDLNNLGDAYFALGNYEKVIPLLKQALSIYETQLGSNHPSTKRTEDLLRRAEKKL